MEHPYRKPFENAVREQNLEMVRHLAAQCAPADISKFLGEMNVKNMTLSFRTLPRTLAATVFEYLHLGQQKKLLKGLGQKEIGDLLDKVAPDDRTMFFEELPGRVTRELLQLLSEKERAVAQKLLGYPERSVGRLMTPHYIAVSADWTARTVLDFVREHGRDSETLTMVYVVGEDGQLLDDIRIRAFLLCDLETPVRNLMDKRFIHLTASDDQDAALTAFRRENLPALPVTDSKGILIGIVTFDDVLALSEAKTTREIQNLGGSEALDEPYMTISMMQMVRKRAGWLIVLFIGEMLTATAMGFFEAEIAKAVVLALFVPLIISSGGNSGSQAATLVIRALALGEVTFRDWWRVMRREFAAGLSLGIILGTIGFLRISIWSLFSNIYGPHWILIAATVGLSLIGIVLWGTLAGSLLPLLLKRLRFDPAASSAPFVATLVDVTGLIIYFGVGMLVLRGTLL